ncbi:MAG: alanine racemase [Clostridiales bacterium]|nr:alanine racemase [Clostridiales bacterium]
MNSLIINKADLINNINVIKNMLKNNEKIIAVVKGNGYGLDLVKYSKILIENGIQMLAVANIDELIRLRKAGIKEEILVLSSTCISQEIADIIENKGILTIGSTAAAELANEIARSMNKNIKVHLKIDTGMGRYGYLYQNIDEIELSIKTNKNLVFDGIYSHFSLAYNKSSKFTKTQYERFINVLKELEKRGYVFNLRHICNSSGFIYNPNMYLNGVRLGTAFLGRIQNSNELGLKRIGKIESQISEIKELPKNYFVGYLSSYKTRKPTKLAIIPVGYMAGFNMCKNTDTFRFVDFLRNEKNLLKENIKREKLKVNINGKQYDVIGKVGMYDLKIDITDSDIKIGDKAYLDVNTLYVDSLIDRKYE